jgi:hypothetical protein
VAPPVVEATGSVDVLGKRYYYRFTGSEGELVNVALSHDEGTLTGRIDLRAPGEQAFYERPSRRSANTTQSNRENSINTWRLNQSGEWIIEVDPAGHSSNVLERAKGAYRLGLYTPEPATAISYDTEAERELVPYEIQLFSFTGSAGDHLNIAELRQGGSGTIDLLIYNEAGEQVNRGSVFGNSSTSFDQTGVFTLPADGAYTIHLDGRQDAEGPYLLGLASIAGPADLAVAPPVVEATGSVDVLGKRYYYRFTGSEGELVNVALSHDEGTLTGRIDLRAPGEQAFYERPSRRSANTTQSNRENSINTWRLNQSGEWIIEVDPAGHSSNVLERAKGAYRLGLYTPEPATAISYDTEAERELVPYEIQLFSFTGSAGDHLNIAELRQGGSGTIDLLIYNEAGEQVNRGSVFGNSSTSFDQTGCIHAAGRRGVHHPP